jgi:hypothetical protein
MNIESFGSPVILDLAGIKANGSIPILLDHDPAQIVGQGRAAVGTSVEITGTVMGTDAPAQKVVALAKNGFAWQASVGASIVRREFLEAGKSATINGRKVSGPLLIARESVLKETSFVAMGADDQTSVAVAARSKGHNVPDITESTDAAAEVARLKAINSVYVAAVRENSNAPAALDRIQAAYDAAVDGQQTAAEFELAVIRAARPTGIGTVHSVRDAADRDTLSASLLLRCNEPLAVKAFGERTCEQARRLRINNLVDLAAAALKADHNYGALDGNRDSMIRAAFSTESLPSILSNTVGRSLVAAYLETTSAWRTFCHIASAENFKQQTGIRPSAIENLEEVGGAGEIKHGTLREEATYQWQVQTFAKMLGVTRKTLIDDDLGFVAELAPMLGQAAGRSLNDLIWQTIMGGETAGFFSSGNGNLLTTGSALAVGTLGQGVSAMRSQRDSQGIDVALSPATLAVPPNLELTARPLLNSALLGRDDGEPTGNPLQGVIPNLAVESRLSNTDRFSGASTTAWYLFAGPAARPLTVGFLQGNQSPVVEIEPAPFDTLGIQLRVVFDYGCALSDPKAALKATGAGGG